MSDLEAQGIPAVAEGPALTQGQRVIYTFTAPSKTFTDIKRSTSWWMPFLIGAIATYILFFAVQAKVGWEQVAENQIRYDGGPWNYGCSILEFRGDKVARETIYITQAWDAPDWRAPWRSDWKEETLG